MWWRRRRPDDDFAQEIQAHLALETDRLIGEGLTPDQARAAAHRAFGNAARTQERFYEARRPMWLHDLRQDVRYAMRTFVKNPGFVAVAVATLALGIGANSAIFTLVNALLFRPLSGEAGTIVGLYSRDRGRPDSYRAFSFPNYVDIREHSGVFDGLMAHTFAMAGEPQGDTMRQAFVELVSSNYFDTLGVRLAAGRPFTSAEERAGAHIPAAIVSYRRWALANFDPAFIGRTIRINAEDLTVVGVAPEGFTGTMALVGAEIYLPLGMFDSVVKDVYKNKGTGLADRSNHGLNVAGRTKPGLSEALVAARLDALSKQLEDEYPAENRDQVLTVSPLSRLSTSTRPQDDRALGAFSGLLLALSGLVLLIACLNIANMLLARGAARRKEVAVRLALGAKRSRIVRQLLTESLGLAVAGAALGLVLSYSAAHALLMSVAGVLPMAISFSARPDTNVLLATTGFAALATIVFGLGPALNLSRRDLVTDLKDLAQDLGAVGRRFGARNLMVVAQIALSLALLTAGGVFVRATMSAAVMNPGYSYDRLLLASVDPGLANIDEARGRELHRSALERVRTMPGVRWAGFASTVPFGGFNEGQTVERVGAQTPDQNGRSARFRITGAEYFASLDLKVLRGREFTRSEEESSGAPPVAMIDQALATALFGDEDPLGQMIRIARRASETDSVTHEPLQVVGIAPPIREELLERVPRPHLYVPFGRHYRSNMHLHAKLAAGMDEAVSLDAVRRELRAVDPQLPIVAVSTMQAFHDRSLELWALRACGQLFSGLSLLALLLAGVGVYGVKSYVVSQRTREIGIRIALGATARDVLRLILRDGFYLTGAGIVIGAPLAALVSLALTKVFVDIRSFDPLVVGLATVVLALAATTASYLPARRATRVTPLRALRTE